MKMTVKFETRMKELYEIIADVLPPAGLPVGSICFGNEPNALDTKYTESRSLT